MNSILVLVVGIGILIAGYVFYGKWLAEQWGVDPKRKTPAFTEEDGVDSVSYTHLHLDVASRHIKFQEEL